MLEDGSGKILAGGMSLIPLMKLRLASPRSRDRSAAACPGLKEITRIGRRGAHGRDGDAPRGGNFAGDPRQVPAAWARRPGRSAMCRCAIWGPSAAAWRMPIPRRIIPAALMALEARIRSGSAQRRAHRASRRISSSTLSPRRWSRAKS